MLKQNTTVLIAISFTLFVVSAFGQSREELIEEATIPLPSNLKEGASVVYLDSGGQRQNIREGNNGITCTTDGPEEGYVISCTHDSWGPLTNRVRELIFTGLNLLEAQSQINVELKEGTLLSPKIGALGNVFSGPDENDVSLVTTIFMGSATGKSTGLPTTPSAGAWLMCSGTPQAHIMVGMPPYNLRNIPRAALCGSPPE